MRFEENRKNGRALQVAVAAQPTNNRLFICYLHIIIPAINFQCFGAAAELKL
jgi:hypothetical protein